MVQAMRFSSNILLSSPIVSVAIVILMILLVIILIFNVSSLASSNHGGDFSPHPQPYDGAIAVDDIEKPLVSEDLDIVESQTGDSFILDIPNTPEDSLVGQTLKRPIAANQVAEEHIYLKRDDMSCSSKYGTEKDAFKGSILNLEVIAGPSRGLHYSYRVDKYIQTSRYYWKSFTW